ncbi:hypothetical protein [Streptomyces sp. NPDC002520]
MSFSRHYEERRGAGVLHLAGFLGADGTGRFTGAIAWVLARARGPVVLEVSGLLGWSPEGQVAVLDLARRLSGRPRPLALCGVGALPMGTLAANRLIPITVHSDLDAALNALETGPE